MALSPRAGASTTIAVVICTRDRPAALQRTLESIWPQTRRPDELMLVDDGELAEAVVDQVRDRCQELGIDFQYVRSQRRGLTVARNLAADQARSETLLYLDDDVDCDTGVVGEIARLMADPRVAAVTANVHEPAFASPSARLFQWVYHLAGWWRVAPRRRPRGPAPTVLGHPRVAVPARWLSGAAMALRRDVVRRHRFDENLTEYALGEDREMGYRLAPEHWLLRARRAHVVHRRETSGRTDPRRFGYMTSYNYLYILDKTCRMGPGQWLLAGWSLGVLALMHLVWSAGPSRRAHLAEARGMIAGMAAFLGARRRRRIPLSDDRRPFSPCPAAAEPWVPRCDSSGAGAGARFADRRVLFVTNRLAPGGAERALVSLVQTLPQFRVRPYVACLQDAGSLAPQCAACGIEVAANLLSSKYDAAGVIRLQTLIREKRIDIVVAAHSGGDRMFWSTLAGASRKTPVVVWSHWFPLSGDAHFERCNRFLYRAVRVFVALGERHRQALIRREYVPAGRVVVIPNGIDLGHFRQGADRTEVRTELGLRPDDLAVALIANLRPEKRHDVFIAAARSLAQRHEQVVFLIVGDGPSRDTVRAFAEASGLPPGRLRLLGPRDDVPRLLSGIDLACLCSEQECFSITMLEAAAAGTAFVAPDTGCLGDFLEHGKTGLLTRPADVASLSAALDALIRDASLRQAIAAAARTKVERGYQHLHMAERFAQLFHSLSDSPSLPRT